MTTKLFKIAGISNHNIHGYKVRFANDMMRVKLMAKNNTDIQFMELPHEMMKPDAVAYLMTTELYTNPVYKEAIDTANAKYNPHSVVKIKRKPGRKPKAKVTSMV